jgi:hypothetical protein
LIPDHQYTFTVAPVESFDNGDEAMFGATSLTAAPPGSVITVTGPTMASEGDGSVLTLSSGTPSTIASWIVTWTDGNGNTVATDALTGSAGSVAYPTGSLDDLEAEVTAVDSAGNSFVLPVFFTDVMPAAPSGLSAVSESPNDVQLTWTNHSSLASENDIYASTDGVNYTFLGSTSSGATSYLAAGLLPNTPYTFEVVAADANGGESTPSATAPATTLVDPWDVQASGSATVLEDGTYQLNLSMDPIAGAPAFGQWTVDWGDGSQPSVYTAQDMTASHVFASGTSSATVQVAATTTSGATVPLTVTAQPIAVDVIPLAPSTPVPTVMSSTEVDLSWTDSSQAATGYDILSSIDGAAFTLIDTVGAGATSYDDTSLDPSDTVQYEIETAGNTDDNVVSPATPATQPVTTPTGVPTLTAVAGAAGSNTAVLTWTYQGNDASSFEIEEEDTSIAGTNFYNIGTPTSTGTMAVSLTPGDTYLFRIRADHTDNSVSDYVQSDPVTIVQADAPTLSVETLNVQLPDGSTVPEIRVGWSGGSESYGINLEVKSAAFAGNAWAGIWYGDQGSGAWPEDNQGASPDPDPFSEDDGFTLDPGVFGPGTYTYRIQSRDANGNPTRWSAPQSATIAGPSGPAPQLTVSGNTITATWPASSGDGPLVMSQDGNTPYIGNGETFINQLTDVQYNASNQTYSVTAGNLQPGTKYDFVLWTAISGTAYGGGDIEVGALTNETDYSFGDASATIAEVAPGAVPTAPAFAHAVYDPSVPGGQVKLSWANTPDNETKFYIYLDRTAHGGKMTFVGSTDTDTTTYIYTPRDNGPYSFRIYSVDGPQVSNNYATASCKCIGGPDITAHLLKIEAGLSKEPANVLSILANGASVIEEQSDWDIAKLKGKSVTSAHNKGTLPDGSHTVTVNGSVYLQADVNYWLYGVWMRLAGKSYAWAYAKVFLHAGTTDEGEAGKTAWFKAGYDGTFSDALDAAVPFDVAPAAAPPQGDSTAPLQWQIGQYDIEGFDDKIHYNPVPR